MASVPPVSRDDLVHHLAIPKLYLRHGGIFEIPYFSFTYYPMNLDLLYLIPLYFNNDILPKYIHFAFAIVTSLMMYRYLTRRINQEYALLGGLFYLSIPIIVSQSSIAYVDLGLVYFLYAALTYMFKWVEDDFKIKYLVISAVFCGLALGTKYNGLIGLLLLSLFVPLMYVRYHVGEHSYNLKSIGYLSIYVFIALIIFSPWMIRNIIWTGNPLYPLYQSVFNRETVSKEMSESDDLTKQPPQMSPFLIRRLIYGESGLEIAIIPLRVFFQGIDNNPKYFDGRANPFLALLPIFAFFGFRNQSRQIKTEKLLMLGFSVFFLLFACAQTDIRIRYFAPIFPPLTVLSMFGLHSLHQHILKQYFVISKPVQQFIIYAIISIMLILNAKYMVERFNYVQPMGYLKGKVSRDEYIQKFRPEYAAMQYANRNLSSNSKILGIYLGNRGYYSDVDIVFSVDLLKQLAAKAHSPEEILENLQKRNITHLLINYSVFNEWFNLYTSHEKEILKVFFKTLTFKEFSKDGNELLRLKDKIESATGSVE
jgi:hypothetical protein